jgi:Family of unknown function (DUF6348)
MATKSRTLVRIGLVVIAAVTLMSRRGATPPPVEVIWDLEPRPASLTDIPPNEFTRSIQEMFEKSGAPNIEVRGAAVSMTGNQTTFAARSFIGSSGSEELEFLITLPDGRIIQDFVASDGDTPQAAREAAVRNFALTTFPVLYAGFFEQNDELQLVRHVTINGKDRQIFIGDFLARGVDNADVKLIRDTVVDAIKSTLPSDDRPHWYKIVYGKDGQKEIAKQAQMDSDLDSDFARALDSFSWPTTADNGFYSVKFFVLVK